MVSVSRRVIFYEVLIADYIYLMVNIYHLSIYLSIYLNDRNLWVMVFTVQFHMTMLLSLKVLRCFLIDTAPSVYLPRRCMRGKEAWVLNCFIYASWLLVPLKFLTELDIRKYHTVGMNMIWHLDLLCYSSLKL